MKIRYFLQLAAMFLLLPVLMASCIWPFGSSASLPVINSFNVNPTSIPAGGSAVLGWNVSNATNIIIDQGVGTVNATGSATITPAATTTYSLIAVNASGTTTRSVTVAIAGASVSTPFVGVPQIQLSVTPTGITPKGTAVLSWSVVGATSAAIDNGIGNVPPSGARPVSPNVPTTYTLTASNPYGTNTSSVYLAVAPPGAPLTIPPPGPPGPPSNREWLGSTHTREYHYPGCSIAQNIPAPSRIWFDKVDQAQIAGYHPCPVCKPPR